MTDPSDIAQQNTDRELWREREGDYYANSIHVTENGGIGINCGGYVIVKPLREWHRLAALSTSATVPREPTEEMINAGLSEMLWGPPEPIWRAMYDAALTERPTDQTDAMPLDPERTSAARLPGNAAREQSSGGSASDLLQHPTLMEEIDAVLEKWYDSEPPPTPLAHVLQRARDEIVRLEHDLKDAHGVGQALESQLAAHAPVIEAARALLVHDDAADGRDFIDSCFEAETLRETLRALDKKDKA